MIDFGTALTIFINFMQSLTMGVFKSGTIYFDNGRHHTYDGEIDDHPFESIPNDQEVVISFRGNIKPADFDKLFKAYCLGQRRIALRTGEVHGDWQSSWRISKKY